MLKADFKENGYIRIPNFVSKVLIDKWADALNWLVETQLARYGLVASSAVDSVKRLSESLIILVR